MPLTSFSLIISIFFLGGGVNSIIIHFLMGKFYKIVCCDKKWGVPPPPLTVLCMSFMFFTLFLVIPRQKTQHEEYEFPSWFHYMEYGILTLTSLIIIMAVGCVCRKYCHICCCSPFGDDDDEQRSKGKKFENSHKLRQSTPGRHRSSIIDF